MLGTARLIVVAAALLGSTIGTDRVADPFGGDTTAVAVGPLVERWASVTAQIERDRAMVESCLTGGSEECGPALKLLAIVSEARQNHGLAVIGHINRAINGMIRPAPGEWRGPLDALAVGSGDCKAYAVAKYFALHEAGVAHVRAVIVRDKPRTHMVVAVYFDGRWWVLDNPTMIMVEDRDSRYVPLFALDEHGVRQYGALVSVDVRPELRAAAWQPRPAPLQPCDGQ